jgi:TetR/AcrR family transcriptional regulator
VAVKSSRRQELLQILAQELERRAGERITTASLAAAAGVSEAALYRHFPSKARMFEALLEFAEEAVFGRVNQILEAEPGCQARCEHLLYLLLAFAERNPGIARILVGDVLLGEAPRLRARVEKFFARFETQLRQVLREAPLRGDRPAAGAEVAAAFLMSVALGRLQQYAVSGFCRSPLADWDAARQLLARSLFPPSSLKQTPNAGAT